MPIVSKAERADFLQQNEPVLYKLCVADALPTILSFRFCTQLNFCYGASGAGSSIPADWDANDLKVIPLWEGGYSLTAMAVSDSETRFIQINFEVPSDVEVIAKRSNGLLFHLFYFLVESLDKEDRAKRQEIEDLAAYLDFDQLELVFKTVDSLSSASDYDPLLELTRSL